MLVIQGLAD